ncbi:hypothetical protein BOTBODRAFT_446089 [Botryobasidium botryosum FD-172 SS1]|uniref:Uncharacterized protein n=1 Tax=Botryobasidium botryosum (strain FD-172 SS1) TaxID=930990 RepID=A0A067MJM6_BOTB1|nr:hypothetical protein BOTBODRAFT_446089 [Botryobasidium botryosum FD-172 SS1]
MWYLPYECAPGAGLTRPFARIPGHSGRCESPGEIMRFGRGSEAPLAGANPRPVAGVERPGKSIATTRRGVDRAYTRCRARTDEWIVRMQMWWERK